MTPLGAILTLFFALAVTMAPRRFAALAVVATICYITQGQQVVVAGFNFTAIRAILLLGLLRVLARGEFRAFNLNRIDWAIIAYAIVFTLINSIRVATSQHFIFMLGCSYDVLLSYFVFRGLLSGWSDVPFFIKGLAVLIVPMAIAMTIESLTHKNIFAVFGGVKQEGWIRDGRLRCQGAFRHGITAGVFGATLVPMFVGLYRVGSRRAAMAGLVSAFVITFSSNSSGPLMAFLSGIVGWCFWPLRYRMRAVRWGILAALVGLHLIMKPPVWYIFSKISIVTGGGGWHRSYLIDQTIHHFSDWWLLGTDSTGDWMPTQMASGHADLTNQYVSSAVGGGLLALILFVLILVRCFKGLGLSIKSSQGSSVQDEILLWGIGAALFAHVVTLFSVTYFDQMHVAWWGFLAIVSGTTSSFIQKHPETSAEEVETRNEYLGSLSTDYRI